MPLIALGNGVWIQPQQVSIVIDPTGYGTPLQSVTIGSVTRQIQNTDRADELRAVLGYLNPPAPSVAPPPPEPDAPPVFPGTEPEP